MVTVKALQLFRNTNLFLRSINREYEGYFSNMPLQIGSVLQVRKPIDPTVRAGATASPQSTVETEVPLVINNLLGVDLGFTDTDFALSIADFSRRFLEPSVNNLGGAVASAIMQGVESGGTSPTGGQQTGTNGFGGISNIINNTAAGVNNSSSPTISPTQQNWLNAGAVLDTMSCPADNRMVVLSPYSEKNTVAYLAGLFNPQRKISEQYEKGVMTYDTLGFSKWMKDQTVLVHNTAAFGTLGTVAGANQTGSTINVSALNGPLNQGDIISFQGVDFVNKVTKADAGVLATFVVTANVSASATVIPIYPPLNPPIASVEQSYQTVTASPANGAAISSPVQASQQYRKNFVFHGSACTAAFIPLGTNYPGVRAHTESFDNFSLRVMEYYTGATMTSGWRLDTLFGALWVRPEWACIVADVTN